MIRKVEIRKINVTKNDTVNKGIGVVAWMIFMAIGMSLIIGLIALIATAFN